jgi:DNA-directed RNA polymerase beta' subunit
VNEKLPKDQINSSNAGAELPQEIQNGIIGLNVAIYEYLKGPLNIPGFTNIQTKNKNGLSMTMQSKNGSIKQFVMAKRVSNSCRTVIIGDPTLLLTEIAMPMYMARRLKRTVRVYAHNYEECLIYYENGTKKYPGSSFVIRNGSRYSTDIVNKTTPLNIGDYIMRDLINGDPIIYNRQPSLEIGSMTCMYVKITEYTTFGMNPLLCKLWAGDFDGDAMNGYIFRLPVRVLR